MSIMDLKKNAPKGEFLAYINKEEAAMLKKAGGSGELVNGIPSFRPQDYGQEAASKKAGFDQSDRSNPYSNASQQANKDLNDRVAANQAQRQRDAIKAELSITPFNRNKPLSKFGLYDARYKAGLINRQIEKKKNAIRNLINKNRGQTYSPHMDTEEMLEAIMGSYDTNTNTFGTHTFNKGLNKGFDFDINQLNKNMPMTGAFGLSPNSRFTKDGKSVPLGTNYLDTTPDLTSHPSTTPSIMGQILGKVSPMNQNTLKSTLNRINQLDDIALGGVTQSEINDYYDRAQGKGKYDIFGGGGDGDGPQPYLPFDYNTGAATTEAVEPYTNDFTYRFGTGQNVGADVLRGYV